MKKQLLVLMAIILTGSVFAQSIPNGGFESWTTTNYENPQYYSTSNGNSKNSGPPSFNVIKTIDSYHGGFAAQLNTIAFAGDTMGAYVANGNPGQPAGQGIPYNQKPTGMRGYYKSNIMLGDTALIIAMFKNAGTVIGMAIHKIYSNHNAYTLFNVPIALPLNPDSVIFAFVSSNLLVNNFKGIPGNMLQLDSVSFTGVASQPVMFNGDFESWTPQSINSLNNWSVNGDFNKSTDFNSGSFALELITSTNNGNTYSGNATTGQSKSMGTQPLCAYSLIKDTLAFYYKYAPATIIDSASVMLQFSKNYSPVGGIMKKLKPSVSYTYCEIPFLLGIAPDSVIVFLSSSSGNWPYPSSFNGSDFKIDNIHFKSQNIILSVNNGGYCAGGSATLTASGATTYSWSPSVGLNATNTASVIANPSVTTTYTVMGMTGTTSVTAISVVNVNPTPSVTVTNGLPCTNTPYVMNANGASTYSWSPSTNLNTSVGSFVVASTNAPTIYTITGTDMAGCKTTITKTVIVLASPTVSASSTSSLLCAGQSATLTATGANSYTWNTASNATNIVITPSITTTYTVIGTAVNGCSNLVSIAQNVSTCTGINQNATTNSEIVSIFPNPNNGNFIIKTDTDMNLNLINSLGQVIQVLSLNENNNHQLYIEGLSSGIYFMTSKNNHGSFNHKVIVTK